MAATLIPDSSEEQNYDRRRGATGNTGRSVIKELKQLGRDFASCATLGLENLPKAIKAAGRRIRPQ